MASYMVCSLKTNLRPWESICYKIRNGPIALARNEPVNILSSALQRLDLVKNK